MIYLIFMFYNPPSPRALSFYGLGFTHIQEEVDGQRTLHIYVYGAHLFAYS
jgi:hypothetical protein